MSETKRPPPPHAFPKGVSGNPAGKPKGTRNKIERPIVALSTVGAGMYAVGSGDAVKLVFTEGTQPIRDPVVSSQVTTGLASQPGAATFVYSSIPRVDMQTYPK